MNWYFRAIGQDFLKITDFLGLDDVQLIMDRRFTGEGFAWVEDRVIRLGVGRHYRRKLLIHELLHIFGLIHTPLFTSSMSTDKVSKLMECLIFQ